MGRIGAIFKTPSPSGGSNQTRKVQVPRTSRRRHILRDRGHHEHMWVGRDQTARGSFLLVPGEVIHDFESRNTEPVY